MRRGMIGTGPLRVRTGRVKNSTGTGKIMMGRGREGRLTHMGL